MKSAFLLPFINLKIHCLLCFLMLVVDNTQHCVREALVKVKMRYLSAIRWADLSYIAFGMNFANLQSYVYKDYFFGQTPSKTSTAGPVI